jgi:hypothetical protein
VVDRRADVYRREIQRLLAVSSVSLNFSFNQRQILVYPLNRHAEPLRGIVSLLKYSNVDWRVLSNYGVQLAIMGNGGIRRQNRGFHWRSIAIGKDPVQRYVDDVSEIQLDLIVTQGVKESIKRLV